MGEWSAGNPFETEKTEEAQDKEEARNFASTRFTDNHLPNGVF